MSDDSTLWRPRPPSAYRSTGKRLLVPSPTLLDTAGILRSAGSVESACTWLGDLDEIGQARVRAVAIPRQVNRERNYLVPSESMLMVAALARKQGWTVVGAIHSHPGNDVEHSRYDDAMTPSRRAVSIVMPCYGNWRGPWPNGLGVHEYFEDYWHLLTDQQASMRVVLTDAPAVEVFDLR